MTLTLYGPQLTRGNQVVVRVTAGPRRTRPRLSGAGWMSSAPLGLCRQPEDAGRL